MTLTNGPCGYVDLPCPAARGNDTDLVIVSFLLGQGVGSAESVGIGT